MTNLAQKHPGVEMKCRFCEAVVETKKHVLLECPFTRMVWALSHISWEVVNSWTEDAADWFSNVLSRLERDATPRFLMLCWALWRNRNRRMMEGVIWEPLRVVNDAQLLLVQY
ncbi:hypothetical protein Salat_2805500 [Sesamum alatum]|uniref:Reverse transcriptase zinc-binding domain-containing protein n=1 Tax=Sesamum alatum TaxID=300844 RepID=A0AAE2C9G8_9LAMI|nr:hypothetical protein Salat_2805500 [Sesamum alatum]